MDADRALASIARDQRGLVTYEQATDRGVARWALLNRVRAGRLEAVHETVYRLAGTPWSWEQHVLAAVLAAGARHWHRTGPLSGSGTWLRSSPSSS